MSSKKKVIIDVKSFAVKKNLRIGGICEDKGVSNVSLNMWRKEAPYVVRMLYMAVIDKPELNVIKIIKSVPNPPLVLNFLLSFLESYDCKFTDIVVEN